MAADAQTYLRDALAGLTRLCAAYDAEGFERRAAERYPDRSRFRRHVELALATAAAADGAAPGLPELIAMLVYLEQLAIPDDSAPPPVDELRVDRELVQQRLSPAALLRAPHQLGEWRAQFDVFQRRYQAAYAAHHEAVRQAAQREAPALARDQDGAHALTLLNRLATLGPPLGDDLPARLAGLAPAFAVCPLTRPQAANALAGRATCPRCDLALGAGLPLHDLERLRAELHNALQAQQRRLARAVVARAVANPNQPAIERFLRAVRAADLRALVGVLDEPTLALIDELLSEE